MSMAASNRHAQTTPTHPSPPPTCIISASTGLKAVARKRNRVLESSSFQSSFQSCLVRCPEMAAHMHHKVGARPYAIDGSGPAVRRSRSLTPQNAMPDGVLPRSRVSRARRTSAKEIVLFKLASALSNERHAECRVSKRPPVSNHLETMANDTIRSSSSVITTLIRQLLNSASANPQ